MVRSTQDLAGGVFLLALAGVALWAGADLPMGRLGRIGPGMLPRALAVLTGVCGIAIVIGALLPGGGALERFAWREPVFVLGGAVAFALTVRSLGLAVAGPLVVLISGFASGETRWRELIVFATVITVFCLFLFKYLLNLPVPLAPWAIGY
jgi:Tripartite tricarboxylate transporter TctB family